MIYMRFVIAALWLLLNAAQHSAVLALLHILLSIVLLSYQQSHIWSALWKVLRWFLIPIILLHALFTPGEAVVAGLPIFISWEGLLAGAWLSLHLLELFLAALVVMHFLHLQDWLYLLQQHQGVYRFAIPYVLLINHMMQTMKQAVQQAYRQWHQQGAKFSELIHVLYALFKLTDSHARQGACELWQQWLDGYKIDSNRQVNHANWIWLTLLLAVSFESGWRYYAG